MYEQNVLSGHNKVIQAHVQSRATGIEGKGHHVLFAQWWVLDLISESLE